MKRYKYVLSSAAILILGVLGLHAQISISVSPDPYQTSNYYCVGQSLTCSIQADSNPAKPTASCCNGTNTGTWTLDSYTYFWQYNGDNNFAIHSSLSPSDSAAYTVPSGTFTLTCTISYVWKCSDGSTGYTYPDQKSSPFNSPAHTFPDDSGNAPPQIPAPNNPPAISEPDQSITSIYVGSGAGLIEMYDLYLKGGKFTNIVDTGVREAVITRIAERRRQLHGMVQALLSARDFLVRWNP